MSTHEQLAHRYIALWNETDPAARRRGIEELWSDDARYVDPPADAPIAGFDVAVTGGDGRLRSVLGFLDRVPAGSAA